MCATCIAEQATFSHNSCLHCCWCLLQVVVNGNQVPITTEITAEAMQVGHEVRACVSRE
jgi:hypothetical protein